MKGSFERRGPVTPPVSSSSLRRAWEAAPQVEAGSSPDTRQAPGSAQISGRGAALHCSLRPIRLAPSLAANPASPPPSTQHACPPTHPPTAGPYHLPRTPVLGRLVTPQVPPLAQRLRADVMLRAGRCGRSCKSAGPDLVSKEPAGRATLVLGPGRTLCARLLLHGGHYFSLSLSGCYGGSSQE